MLGSESLQRQSLTSDGAKRVCFRGMLEAIRILSFPYYLTDMPHPPGSHLSVSCLQHLCRSKISIHLSLITHHTIHKFLCLPLTLLPSFHHSRKHHSLHRSFISLLPSFYSPQPSFAPRNVYSTPHIQSLAVVTKQG